MNRTPHALLVLVATSVTSGLLFAGEPTAADRSAAELLFEQARKLTQAGRHAEACPKYAESQRLDPGVGTLLYLADCYEKVGKTASAWIGFRDAASLAISARQNDRVKVAQERAAALEPKLVRLSIEVPASSEVAGLEVLRDGSPLGRAQWGLPTPVDPGQHMVTAQAPGAKPFTRVVDASEPGKTVTVQVPKLEKEGGAPPPPASTPSTTAPPPTSAPPPATTTGAKVTTSGGSQRTLGLVGIGVGGVSVLAGTFFGLKASSTWSDAKSHCTGDVCDATANQKSKDAKSQANLSTIFFVVGAVAGGAGAALYLTSKDDGPKAAAAPLPGGFVLSVSGRM